MNIVVTYPIHAFRWFEEIAIAVNKTFNELGHKSDVIASRQLEYFNGKPYDVVFVLAAHEYIQKGSAFFNKDKKKVYSMWELEQIPHYDSTCKIMKEKWIQAQKYIDLYDIVLTESECKTKFLINKGYNAHTVPIGYHPHFTNIHSRQNNKNLDIFFTGIMFDRRKAILDALSSKGCKVFRPPLLHNFFDPKQKAEVISRSKVCINIHHNECNAFEKPRIIQDYMSNCAFVISEKIDHPEHFVNGKHWIMTDYNNLVDVTMYWLNKSQRERDLIAKNAFGYIRSKYSMHIFLQEFIEIAEGKASKKR